MPKEIPMQNIPEQQLREALKTGDMWDPEKDNAELTAVEEAKRKLFYRRCIEGNLDLDARHKEIIAKAMATRKTAAWASYDGEDVKLERIEVKEDRILIKFDFYDGMNIVTETVMLHG